MQDLTVLQINAPKNWRVYSKGSSYVYESGAPANYEFNKAVTAKVFETLANRFFKSVAWNYLSFAENNPGKAKITTTGAEFKNKLFIIRINKASGLVRLLATDDIIKNLDGLREKHLPEYVKAIQKAAAAVYAA